MTAHNWKFDKGQKIKNKHGIVVVIKDRWLDGYTETGEWYSTNYGGTDGYNWVPAFREEVEKCNKMDFDAS